MTKNKIKLNIFLLFPAHGFAWCLAVKINWHKGNYPPLNSEKLATAEAACVIEKKQ